jgi:Tfp pilus assembly protein FimT
MNTNSRQFIGSSLVELLTVIAIFSLLSILGLGAVQKVRSASEDVSRQNWRIQHRLGVNIPRKQPIRMLFVRQ